MNSSQFGDIPDIGPALSRGFNQLQEAYRPSMSFLGKDNPYQKQENELADLARQLVGAQEKVAQIPIPQPRRMTPLELLIGAGFATAGRGAAQVFQQGLNAGYQQENEYRRQKALREQRLGQAQAQGLESLFKYKQGALGRQMDYDASHRRPDPVDDEFYREAKLPDALLNSNPEVGPTPFAFKSAQAWQDVASRFRLRPGDLVPYPNQPKLWTKSVWKPGDVKRSAPKKMSGGKGSAPIRSTSVDAREEQLLRRAEEAIRFGQDPNTVYQWLRRQLELLK